MKPNVRAWDKVNKEMIEDVASIHFKAKMISTYNLFFYPFKDIELLQSTGLKDINGKEIFEGHIVEFKNPYDKRSKARGVIVWREDKACFGIDMEGTTEQFELYRITAENYLTVIGNIYQDEHLLGEE
ncbi:YopX family protein [Mammaliicoccus sciuri]|uniref:YopX family protein n=1 Tax=Mammaliicoccus sciuri TaxID=1296 RepID=UPI002DBA87A9|nr:YopX family protein [Mammaliicoccus sciuri]MEB6232517.1 YopX family protein [Mammaliicoccus sciuri]